MPFCLSWANEPWSRRWDGSEDEVIVEQDYGSNDEWKEHFEYLLQFFRDSRYIRNPETNRPVFLIYRPSLITDVEEMISEWEKLAQENGLPGIEFIIQYPEQEVLDGKIREGFEGFVEFEPLFTTSVWMKSYGSKIKFSLRNLFRNFAYWKYRMTCLMHGGRFACYSYDMTVKDSCKKREISDCYPGAFPGWDNTAGKGVNAACYCGNTPEKFYKYLKTKLEMNDKFYHKPFIFINAWNEWGEGTYLEPDERYGYGYLEKIRKTVDEC